MFSTVIVRLMGSPRCNYAFLSCETPGMLCRVASRNFRFLVDGDGWYPRIRVLVESVERFHPDMSLVSVYLSKKRLV